MESGSGPQEWKGNGMTTAKIGIIGGSGLYQMPELSNVEEIKVETPFGDPSDAFIVGTLEGERVAFLPRHDAWAPTGNHGEPFA